MSVSGQLVRVGNEQRLQLHSEGSILDTQGQPENKVGVRAYTKCSAFFAKFFRKARDIVVNGQKYTVNKNSLDKYMIRVTTGQNDNPQQNRIQKAVRGSIKEMKRVLVGGNSASKVGRLVQAHAKNSVSLNRAHTGRSGVSAAFTSKDYWTRLFSTECESTEVELPPSRSTSRVGSIPVQTFQQFGEQVIRATQGSPSFHFNADKVQEQLTNLHAALPEALLAPEFKDIWSTYLSTPGILNHLDFPRMTREAESLHFAAIQPGTTPKMRIKQVLSAGLPVDSTFRKFLRTLDEPAPVARVVQPPPPSPQKEAFINLGKGNEQTRKDLAYLYESGSKHLFTEETLPIWRELLFPLGADNFTPAGIDFEILRNETMTTSAVVPAQQKLTTREQIIHIVKRATHLGPHLTLLEQRISEL